MAIKIFCDRCGVEINPRNSSTYTSVRCMKYELGD